MNSAGPVNSAEPVGAAEPSSADRGPAAPVAAFLRLQVESLAPLDFISVGMPMPPFAATQIGRTLQDTFEVRVPPQEEGRPIELAQRTRLGELGFASPAPADGTVPWTKEVGDLDAALDEALTVMRDVLGGDVRAALDVLHGSSRAYHEAQQRLEELRRRIEPMLAELDGRQPQVDADGDYTMRVGEVSVIIVPRVIPGAMTVVRVVAVTNSEVTIGPELGLFLARLNFGLMFGRFALDVEHRAIWFDETLLGDGLTAEQLRFTVEMVSHTATEWRQRLQQMFGGGFTEVEPPGQGPAGPVPARPKPGAAGYL